MVSGLKWFNVTLLSLALLLALGSTLFYLYPVHGFWILVSNLGSTEFYMVFLPIAYHALPRIEALGLALALLTATTVTGVLKDVFKLPRPPEHQWIVREEGYGFPSGHSTGSSAFWGYLSLYKPLAPLIAFTAVMVVAVSVSRLMLGVHYPRDVAGGVVVGVVVASLSYVAVRVLSFRGLVALALVIGVLGSALYSVGFGRFEPPSVLLGVALGELVGSRFNLVYKPGWAFGVIGSIVALALGVPALMVKGEAPVASLTLMMLAGFLAVLAPRAAYRVMGGFGEKTSGG